MDYIQVKSRSKKSLEAFRCPWAVNILNAVWPSVEIYNRLLARRYDIRIYPNRLRTANFSLSVRKICSSLAAEVRDDAIIHKEMGVNCPPFLRIKIEGSLHTQHDGACLIVDRQARNWCR